jgi:hypothetical protein
MCLLSPFAESLVASPLQGRGKPRRAEPPKEVQKQGVPARLASGSHTGGRLEEAQAAFDDKSVRDINHTDAETSFASRMRKHYT